MDRLFCYRCLFCWKLLQSLATVETIKIPTAIDPATAIVRVAWDVKPLISPLIMAAVARYTPAPGNSGMIETTR